jgi:predicted metal-dependent peptidase
MAATTHEDKINVARAYTHSRAPYFASIIYGFIYVPLPGIRTMLCTPGMILGYDPAWAERATIEELGADIFHECHHFCRRHFLRRGMIAHPDLFNLGADFAINPDLKHAGWKLAADAVFPTDEGYKFPEGLTAEEYYDLLLQQRMQQQQQKKEEEKDGSKSGGNQSQGDGQPTPQEGEKKDGGGPGEGGKEGQPKGVGSGCCGGIAGNPQDVEKQLESIPDLQPRTEAEVQAIEIRAAKEIKAYFDKQQGRGNAPAFLSEFLKALEEEPLVPWEEELAQITHDCVGLIQSGGDDYSLRRPSKRTYLRQGILRPGLIEHKPEVAIILDTSGSMGKTQLLDSVRETVGIMDALGIDEIWFCEADAAVAQKWQRVDLDFFRELKIAGRGGTDFRPAIKSVEELHPVPDLVFYETDGDGTAPDRPPPFELVWVIVPSHWNKAPVTWGHTVFVTNDKKKRKELREAVAAQQSSALDLDEYDDADDIG